LSPFLTSIPAKANLRFMLTTDVLRIRSAGIYMANTTIFFVSLSTVDSHQRLTIYSSATMSIEVNSPSKPYAYFSHTRSSILRTFSFSVGTMNVPQSTVYMGFTMSVRGDTILSCGRHSPTASIACQLQPSLMRKSSRCMEVWAQIWTQWSRFVVWCDLQTYVELLNFVHLKKFWAYLAVEWWPADCFRYPIAVSYATCYGRILIKISLAGAKTTVVSRSHSGPTSYLDSCRNTIWILSAVRTKSSRTATNSSQKGSSSLYSVPPIIVGNSTMQALWWAWTRACYVRFRYVWCPRAFIS